MPHLLYASLCALIAWNTYPVDAQQLMLSQLSLQQTAQLVVAGLTGLFAFAGVVNSLNEDRFWPWLWRWQWIGSSISQLLLLALAAAAIWWSSQHLKGTDLTVACALAGALACLGLMRLTPEYSQQD